MIMICLFAVGGSLISFAGCVCYKLLITAASPVDVYPGPACPSLVLQTTNTSGRFNKASQLYSVKSKHS